MEVGYLVLKLDSFAPVRRVKEGRINGFDSPNKYHGTRGNFLA
jgi:hypothetical protein